MYDLGSKTHQAPEVVEVESHPERGRMQPSLRCELVGNNDMTKGDAPVTGQTGCQQATGSRLPAAESFSFIRCDQHDFHRRLFLPGRTLVNIDTNRSIAVVESTKMTNGAIPFLNRTIEPDT